MIPLIKLSNVIFFWKSIVMYLLLYVIAKIQLLLINPIFVFFKINNYNHI